MDKKENHVMVADSFLQLLISMRKWQREYFEKRSQAALMKAKRYEGLVDLWLEQHAKEMELLAKWEETNGKNGGSYGRGNLPLL